MTPSRKHFVIFYSPGTFVSEATVKPIESWDPAVAAELAKDVVERYGATPYGFRFETKIVADPIPDGEGGTLRVEPKIVQTSPLHHLGGIIERYDDIATRHDERDTTVLSNMRSARYPLVVTTTSSFKHTAQFLPENVAVDLHGAIVARGTDPEWAAYRDTTIARWEREDEEELAAWRARREGKK